MKSSHILITFGISAVLTMSLTGVDIESPINMMIVGVPLWVGLYKLSQGN